MIRLIVALSVTVGLLVGGGASLTEAAPPTGSSLVAHGSTAIANGDSVQFGLYCPTVSYDFNAPAGPCRGAVAGSVGGNALTMSVSQVFLPVQCTGFRCNPGEAEFYGSGTLGSEAMDFQLYAVNFEPGDEGIVLYGKPSGAPTLYSLLFVSACSQCVSLSVQ